MDNPAAEKRVQNTFSYPFNEDKFKTFSRDMFRGLNESKAFSVGRAQIKEAFRAYIKSYKRIGQYIDDNGEVLDVLIVKLDKSSSLDKARTLQRNFVADYLKERDGKDAAIVAFHHEEMKDWRFSFVKMEYKTDLSGGKIKIKTELTPARRYSFLVGENEPNHTAQQQITPLLQREDMYSLSEVEDAFNIESITKEFFNKYKELFLEVKDELDNLIEKNSTICEDFETHDLTSEAFAKKLLGQIVFLYFLQKKGWLGVKESEKWGSGPKRFLKSLFEDKTYSNFFNDILEPLFYDALAVKQKNDFYKNLNCKIPFLNGGLFDPINDYDWRNTDITINNDTFRKIFETFDLYNFTVKEDEPLEKEVAIDPEMLGKVFENLLEVKDRKSKGAFYTPREIVHYMCQESLINYLDVKLNTEKRPIAEDNIAQGTFFEEEVDGELTEDVYIEKVPKKDIEEFIRRGDIYIDYALRNKAKRDSGDNISGVYKQRELPPSIIQRADIVNELLHEVKICDPAIGSGAFPVGLMNEIVRARYALSAYGEANLEKTVYNFKRHCIKESIYGVDIDSSAVEIAKLRLWLSLIVDEDDLDSIEPLPNLDYKIVCGNSLLGVDHEDMFVTNSLNEIEKLKKQYFETTGHQNKKELHTKIDDILYQVTGQRNCFDFKVYFSEIFHNNIGFDIIIANPPYVNIANIDPKIKKYLKEHYVSATKRFDLYIIFLEKSLMLLKKHGISCFIVPYSILSQDNATEIRSQILENKTLLKILNCSDVKVFDNATVFPVVLLLQNHYKEGNKIIIDETDKKLKINTQVNILEQDIFCDFYEKMIRIDINNTTYYLINKIQKKSIFLEEIAITSWGARGVPVANFHLEEKVNDNCKPMIKGKDVQRYKLSYRELYLLYDLELLYRPAFKELFESEKICIQKVTGRNGLIASYDNNSYYTDDSINCVILKNNLGHMSKKFLKKRKIKIDKDQIRKSNNFKLKYILAILNSKLENFYFNNMLGYKLNVYPEVIEHLLILNITSDAQQPFITLVDIILGKKEKGEDTAEEERQIDQMVYELYELTPEEIAIVEGSN